MRRTSESFFVRSSERVAGQHEHSRPVPATESLNERALEGDAMRGPPTGVGDLDEFGVQFRSFCHRAHVRSDSSQETDHDGRANVVERRGEALGAPIVESPASFFCQAVYGSCERSSR
jgi:hypothetical protein